MDETLKLIELAHQGDKAARDRLVTDNMGLIWSIVKRFAGRGYEQEDLFQIGSIGLIKAIDKFDLNYQVRFSTYAVPMISGEIRRFLRDDGMIKVSRSLKELAGKVFLVKEELSDCYGRDPTVEEIAGKLGVSSEEVAASLEAGAQVESIYRPLSATEGEKGVLMDKLEEKSEAQEQLLNRLTLEKVMKDLAPQEKELILRRYLGLPWLIDETERLYIREFVKEDAENIPEEEYGKEEEIFRDPDKLEVYIKNQYGFYEYGTWAVLKKSPSLLIGMAGVSNPNLPETALQALPTLPDDLCWLELGYHIFKPYRKNGYATEAAKAILSYSHEVLSARLCAWIEAKNKASCALAESLGMEVVKVISDQTATGWPGAYLLYAEKMQ